MHIDNFVVPVPAVERQRREPLDLYGATADGARRPAVVIVHGGAPDTPAGGWREFPLFIAYASLLARRGVVAILFNHRMTDADRAPLAADDVTAAVEAARAHEGVDPDRVALWFFSMGGVLAAAWLRTPPPWLRGIAWNYPVLAPGSDWHGDIPRFDCVDAVTSSPLLPKLLLRVEHELPYEFCAPTQDAFVDAARASGANLDVIEIPGAHHPFEDRDHTETTRAAVYAALDWITDTVGPAAVPDGTTPAPTP